MTAPSEPPDRRTAEGAGRPRGRWRRRLRALLLAVAALYPLYLAGANLFLATPLALRAANRRPERVAVAWQRAWSLYPGDLRVRGLTVEIHTRASGWRLAVGRGRALVDLPALADRRFRVSRFDGEGFTAEPIAVEPPPERPPAGGGRPWRFEFDGIEIAGPTEIGLGPLRLAGDGRLAGSFRRTSRGPFELPAASLRMAGAHLLAGEEPVADGLEVTADAAIAPYVPADHPGLEGLDFVSGTLTARGDLRAWPRLAGGEATAGELDLDFRLEEGVVAPGTRLAVRAPEGVGGGDDEATAGSGGAFRAVLEVAPGPAPRLVLDLDAPGFTLPRRGGDRPLLHADALKLTASTPERRLARLLADARKLGEGEPPPEATSEDTFEGLWGEFEGDSLGLELGGSRVTWGLDLDRARGRIDLAALTRREVRLDGVRAEGVDSRIAFPAPAAPASETEPPARPWAVAVTDLVFEGVREIGFGDVVVAGAGRCEGGLTYDREGVLAVPAARITVAKGRITVAGEPAADRLDLRLAGGLDGLSGRSTTDGGRGSEAGAGAAGAESEPESGTAALVRGFSGTLALRARIRSLGFLRRYLAATPWLALQGRGDLEADLALDRGRLRPGSEFSIGSARVEATLLDDLATGDAAVSGKVGGPADKPRLALAVVFRRFSLGPPGQPPHVRGSGLKMSATTSVVDLTSPVEDLAAEVDLRDGEVPDLTSYNTYFPPSAGLALAGGRGRLRFHFRLAGDGAGGELSLHSDDLALLFKELRMDGRLALETRLAATSLRDRTFDLDGTRLALKDVTYHDLDEEAADAKAGWWAEIEIGKGTLTWGRPLAVDGALSATMRDTGLLMSLFAQKKRYLKWFEDALTVEGVAAEGRVRLAPDEIRIEPLAAASGKLTLRSRLRLAKGVQRGDLLVRYGVFKVGIELRDGKRDFKLLHPEAWFDRREGFD